MDDAERAAFAAWRVEMDALAREPLSEEAIGSLCDADLDAVVARKIDALLGDDVDQWEDRLRRLSPGQRALWATCWAEDEIHNGGFQQYFFNAAGRFAPDAAEGFRLLGAREHASIVERAMEVYRDERPMQDALRAHPSTEALAAAYEETRLTELDPVFWNLCRNTDLMALRACYVRAHAAEFADG